MNASTVCGLFRSVFLARCFSWLLTEVIVVSVLPLVFHLDEYVQKGG